MRWVYLTMIIVLAAITIIFAAQNFQTVTMSLLNFSIRMPLALLIAIIYFLGAITGGSLFAFIRRSVEGSRRGMTVAS
jgi:putative membrane protein